MLGPLVQITVETRRRCELIDVTAKLSRLVSDAGIAEGLLTAQVLHTTAGLTINENADPDVARDLLAQLERLAPARGDYAHAEGNSDAHIKSTLVGATLAIPVAQGKLALGTWQGVYLCEFDGPRTRKINVRVMG
jgi:secondary thiamine-phosphate synthase enzyme